MKSITQAAVLVAVVVGVFFAFPNGVAAESIREFISDISIHTDGSIVVAETITYDFGSEVRHGIFRTLPYRYSRDALKYTLRYEVLSVQDEAGTLYMFETSRSGGYLTIQIGDPEATVTGVVTYVVTYTVSNAINYFDDHDELYWNVTGNEWQIPIEAAAASVTLPERAAPLRLNCYVGLYGAIDADCLAEPTEVGLATFSSYYALESNEGLTIVVSLPKEVVVEPTALQRILRIVGDNWYFVIPVFVWIFLHLLWLRKGRDPRFRGPVIPEYDPPDAMRPAVLGALWDTKADTKEISATIIDLAVRGYLKIHDLGKKEYEFTILKADLGEMDPIEREVFLAVFGKPKVGEHVTLSSLKNKFYAHVPDIRKKMYEQLVAKGYFARNPQALRSTFVGAGLTAVVLAFFFAGISTPAGFGVLIPIGVLSIIYGWIMPAKTVFGVKAHHNIKGFRWFLSVTEKERLKFHNAPEKKPEQFEKFLPYAMVLGVEKQWAEQFQGMMIPPPSWYDGNISAFSTVYFVSAMSGLSSKMNSTFVSRPGSAGGGASGFGGGGFSGGGFGGGGGGSW